MIEHVTVTRYVTPLREGGSLPGVVEASDLGTYVCKFVGAGQGAKVLVAEVIAAGLATRLGLRTPRLVALELDPEIARYEADEEVQDLLNASAGLNLGVDFLAGSFGYDAPLPEAEGPEVGPDGGSPAGPDVATRILWLDAFIANVDRTWRNPNLLVWHRNLWVIDHGASLYFHYGWAGGVTDPARFAALAWDPAGHVFADRVPTLAAADPALRGLLDREAFTEILAEVPDAWLEPVPGAEDPASLRAAYVDFLAARLGSTAWLPEAAR